MRRFDLIPICAILVALPGPAGAQVAAQIRPMRIAPVADTSLASALADLQKQVAALSAKVTEQQTEINQLKSSLQTTAIKGYDTAGKLEALRTAFVHHDHYYTLATQSGGNQSLQTTRVTPPSMYCKKVGSTGQAIDQYQCSDGY